MPKKNLSQSITDAWKTAVETGQRLDENKQKREQEVSKVIDSTRNNVLHHIQENDHGFYRPDIDPLFGSVDGGMLRKQRLMEQEGVTQEDKPPVEGTPDNTEGIFVDDVEPDLGFTGGGAPSLGNVEPGGPGREDEEPEPEFDGGGSPSLDNVEPGGPGREDEGTGTDTEDDGTGGLTPEEIRRAKKACEYLCTRLRGKLTSLPRSKAEANIAKRNAGGQNANTEMRIVQGKRTRVYHGRADKRAAARQNHVDILVAEIEEIELQMKMRNCPDCGFKYRLPDTSTDETEAPVTGAPVTGAEAPKNVTDGGKELGGDGTDISGGTGPPLPDAGGRAPNVEDRPIDDPQGPPTVASEIAGAIERAGRTIDELEGMTEDALIAVSYTHLTLPTIYSV